MSSWNCSGRTSVYVSVTSSDVERVASVWYEEPHHRTVEQTMTELEELVEEPGSAGNLA